MIVLFCGLPGTGKSHLSRKLAEVTDAVCISSDSIRMKVLKERTYSDEEKKMVYGKMAEEAKNALLAGKKVIADATFYLRKNRKLMKEIAEETGSKFFIIHCTAPDDVVRKRMEKGRKYESEANFKIYLKIKEDFEPICGKHLVLDTTESKDVQLRKVLDFIGWKNE